MPYSHKPLSLKEANKRYSAFLRSNPMPYHDINLDEGNNCFMDAKGDVTFRSSMYGKPQSFSHLHGAARVSAALSYIKSIRY